MKKKKIENNIEDTLKEVKNISKMTVTLIDCMLDFATTQIDDDKKLTETN